MSARQYGRSDVDYASFYSPWMKSLALLKTRKELESMAGASTKDARNSAAAHLRAIEATGSMTGQSQRRAQTGNCTRGAGEKNIALSGALEIYDLFPEHTKDARASSPNRGEPK